MALDEIIHIVIAPQGTADSILAEKVASLLNKDPASIRYILSARSPRIITQCDNLKEAELTVDGLKALGLTAFSYNDSELRKPTPVFKAYTLEFGHKEILFRDRLGQENMVTSANAFLIIKGTLEILREGEVVDTKKKISITATLLTGIPIKRTVREKSKKTSVDNESFLRLYVKPPSDLCIEIKPASFNFSCLGEEMALSSLMNFALLTRKMREMFTEAIFYDKVRESERMTMPNAPHHTSLDITCKLIYKYYQVSYNL